MILIYFLYFATHNAELIPQVAYVRKIIEEKHLIHKSRRRVNCHLFVSLVAESDEFNFHHDDMDTYICQIQSETFGKFSKELTKMM